MNKAKNVIVFDIGGRNTIGAVKSGSSKVINNLSFPVENGRHKATVVTTDIFLPVTEDEDVKPVYGPLPSDLDMGDYRPVMLIKQLIGRSSVAEVADSVRQRLNNDGIELLDDEDDQGLSVRAVAGKMTMRKLWSVRELFEGFVSNVIVPAIADSTSPQIVNSGPVRAVITVPARARPAVVRAYRETFRKVLQKGGVELEKGDVFVLEEPVAALKYHDAFSLNEDDEDDDAATRTRLITTTTRGKHVVVIDVGHSTTDMALMTEGRLVTTRQYLHGGANLTDRFQASVNACVSRVVHWMFENLDIADSTKSELAQTVAAGCRVNSLDADKIKIEMLNSLNSLNSSTSDHQLPFSIPAWVRRKLVARDFDIHGPDFRKYVDKRTKSMSADRVADMETIKCMLALDPLEALAEYHEELKAHIADFVTSSGLSSTGTMSDSVTVLLVGGGSLVPRLSEVVAEVIRLSQSSAVSSAAVSSATSIKVRQSTHANTVAFGAAVCPAELYVEYDRSMPVNVGYVVYDTDEDVAVFKPLCIKGDRISDVSRNTYELPDVQECMLSGPSTNRTFEIVIVVHDDDVDLEDIDLATLEPNGGSSIHEISPPMSFRWCDRKVVLWYGMTPPAVENTFVPRVDVDPHQQEVTVSIPGMSQTLSYVART